MVEKACRQPCVRGSFPTIRASMADGRQEVVKMARIRRRSVSADAPCGMVRRPSSCPRPAVAPRECHESLLTTIYR